MSQQQREDAAAAGEQNPDTTTTNDRREFIRQSLGVAPLMLTLGNRSNGGGASIHGTLWASLGTKWKHKGDWWRFKDRWHWSKGTGDRWRGRERRAPQDWRRADRSSSQNPKTQPAPKDWDWSNSEARWRRELEAKSRPNPDPDWRGNSEIPTTRRNYDWREDDAWKRSEGLPHLPNRRSTGKKD